MMVMIMLIRRLGTKFIMMIKEKETRLTIEEYDDGDDPGNRWKDLIYIEDHGTGKTPNISGL